MLNDFRNFVENNLGVHRRSPVLLAVSGGADSMVMLDLFCKAEFSVAVAHVNYKLRGKESDADEAFVKDYCETRGIKFYSVSSLQKS